MDNITYATLGRQTGLMDELRVLANNVANASTAGFRREETMFAEYVAGLGQAPSLSMGTAMGRHIDTSQGALDPTGGQLDLAIEGEGFFTVATPAGDRLTRAGAFATNQAGEIVTPDGYQLLDLGGAPVFLPPNAGEVAIGRDGTVSAGGVPLAQIGLVTPEDPATLKRVGATLFEAPDGVRPLDDGTILQGFVEASNVDPMTEIARLIEVQRAYEQGQKFLDQEDQRVRSVIQTLGR